MINRAKQRTICWLKAANSLPSLLAPGWCLQENLNGTLTESQNLIPSLHSLLSGPAWITIMVTLIPPLTDLPHANPLICDARNAKAWWSSVLGSWTEAPVLEYSCSSTGKAFLFFLDLWIHITVLQMFLMDVTEVQLRKSEFITFGVNTEHIPYIGERLKHSFWFLKPDRRIKGLLFLFWHV